MVPFFTASSKEQVFWPIPKNILRKLFTFYSIIQSLTTALQYLQSFTLLIRIVLYGSFFYCKFKRTGFLANPKECFAKIIYLTFAFVKKFCLTSRFVDKFNNNYVGFFLESLSQNRWCKPPYFLCC